MKREARAAQFNDKTRWLQAKDSDVPGPKRGVGVAVSPMPMPPLPAAQSTTVILGFVEKYQPFLSQDRTTVYTEFTVRIEEVFKDTSSVAHVKDSIVLTKLGGVLQLPNGKVVRDAPATGTTNIDVQRRYVLFLNYAQPLNAFGVVTAWELKGGRVFAVTPQNRRTAFEGTSSYQNMEENSFLAAVRQSTSIGK